jgi:hypothetical protein
MSHPSDMWRAEMFAVHVEEDKEGRWALAGPGKLTCCGEEK